MKLQIEIVPINTLKQDKDNAKEHTERQVNQIKKSIKKFGMIDPIGVWGKENIIVEGHGRYLALKDLGYENVPVIKLDFKSKKEATEYALIHNKTTMNTGFDLTKLNIQLKGIDIDFMRDFDFDLGNQYDEKTIIEDDFDFSEQNQKEPIAKLGDIFKLGQHFLMCGDSTDRLNVNQLIKNGGGCVNLYLTDPPYNVDYTGKTEDNLKIKNDHFETGDKFKEFLISAFKNAYDILMPGACFYIWHADSEGYNFRSACFEVGLKIKECLIWNKNSMVLGRQDYQWKHEPCLYGWKEGAAHHWYNDRSQTTVLEFKKPTKSESHPTMKPVELFAYLIQNSTKQGDKVYDSFGGSGTTLIACEQINRQCFMMELDPIYVDVVIQRWEKLTGKKAEKIN